MRRLFKNYYLLRLLKALLTIYIVTTLTFFLIRLMPGNPLDIYISQQVAQGTPYQDAVQMASSIFQVDLNQPMHVQYVTYMKNLLHGDFGVSIVSAATPVTDIIMRFLPWTLFVVTISLFISFVLGAALGTLMAYKRNSWFDHLLTSLSSIITSIPNYVIAMLIVVIFGVTYEVFDVGKIRGAYSPGMLPAFSFEFLIDALYHASLPIITYILCTIGNWMLMMKSSTVATLGEDYVNVARARGLSDGRITTAYVGRNAILPLFTTLAISIGFVVGGSTLIESIFQYAGIGLKLSAALTERDYPVIQAIFIIITTSVVLANVLADLFYSLLDPRIRTEGR